MTTQSIAAPEDQKVTWVELFFDLVFVFCVTQVVSILHDGITAATAGRAVLLFWLVWWAWTQFTWTLNAADTTHHRVELLTLMATAVAFFMAVTLPVAFERGALWFAVTYVVVRLIGLAIYAWVASGNPMQRAAVTRFAIVSLGGLAAVIAGGVTGGTSLQYWFWGGAILLDIVAALFGAESEGWGLHPQHFAERHGLFVIIALGESVIVAAAGASKSVWSADLILVAMLTVAITCALWWIYFARAKPQLDHELESREGITCSSLGRDAFSLLHFPIVCGVIGYAAAVEAAISHSHDPFSLSQRVMLAAGLLLYAGGMTLATRRAGIPGFAMRTAIMLATAAAIVGIDGVTPVVTLAIALIGVTMIAVVEHRPLALSP